MKQKVTTVSFVEEVAKQSSSFFLYSLQRVRLISLEWGWISGGSDIDKMKD